MPMIMRSDRSQARMSGSRAAALVVLALAMVILLWTTEWMDRLSVFGGGSSLSSSTFYANNKPTIKLDGPDTVYEVNEDDIALPATDTPGKKPSNTVKRKEAETTMTPTRQRKNDDSVTKQGSPTTPTRVESASGEIGDAGSGGDDTEDDDDVDNEEGAEIQTGDEDDDNNEGEDLSKPSSSTASNVQRLQICVSSTNPRTASLFHSQTLKRKGGGKFDYVVTSKRCPSGSINTPPVSVKMMYQKTLSNYSPAQLDALFSSPENLVIVMGDEFCRCPVEICSARAHARQYYSQSYVDYLTQHPNPDANPTVYLPLGPRLEFSPVQDSEIVPSSKRKFDFNLIVSPTSPSRKRLASMVQKGGNSFGSTFVHVTPAFAGNASEAKGFVAPDEYRRILLNSKFTLCPAGHNPEAFRIFEACEAGSIPILVRDEEYREHFCKDSFAPLIASGAPFIVLNSWSELSDALKPFRDDPALLDERQAELKQWYKRFWSDVARDFECSITQNIERMVRKSSSKLNGFSLDGYDVPECGDDEEEKEADLSLKEDDDKVVAVIKANTNDDFDDDESEKSSSGPGSNSKIAPTPLIVGCGRTGTLSLSHYLVKSAGVKSVHEKMEPYSVSVSWLYAVPDAAVYPFEGKRSPGFRRFKVKALKRVGKPLFGPVVHVVRHPLKVISSTRRCFCGRGTRSTGLGQASDAKSWQFVDEHIRMPKPNLPYDSLLRSMTYWYEWNAMIPKRHKIVQRFRIEDLDPNQLVEALELEVPEGVELPHRVPRAPSHVSPDSEKSLLPDATWKDLHEEDAQLAEKIFRLAKEYGYEKEAETIADLIT